MSWLKTAIEGIVHWSNFTHIANAYPTEIWVCFHNEQLNVDKLKIEAGIKNKPSGNIGIEMQKVTNTSWIKVCSGSTHKKNREARVEFVTIVSCGKIDAATSAKSNISGKVLVYNYEVTQNISFVVTHAGEFIQQKYGSGNLFEDYLGVDHAP